MVEHCSANAEAMGSNPVQALKNVFFGLVYDHLTSNLQSATLKNHVGDFSWCFFLITSVLQHGRLRYFRDIINTHLSPNRKVWEGGGLKNLRNCAVRRHAIHIAFRIGLPLSMSSQRGRKCKSIGTWMLYDQPFCNTKRVTKKPPMRVNFWRTIDNSKDATD